MDATRWGLSRPILSGVRRDGHNRRAGGHTPLAASDCAVEGGASVVPVRPHRHPLDLVARRDRPTGSLGIVSRTCPYDRAGLSLDLRLRGFARRRAERRGRLAGVCAAPPTGVTWSIGW